MKKLLCVSMISCSLILAGCADIDHMSTGQKALLGAAAAAAVGGIAYGVHKNHKAEQESERANRAEHNKSRAHNARHSDMASRGNSCQEWHGHIECAPDQN
ncbi:hypothetical protein J9885_07475 [Aeromonas sp. SrichE-2G]|uniref:hypothetical protein n=1 Tax=Aeromonas TaxID=642 RepID=UPI001B329BB0|nr:hypothetical protein [Aeromonas sp. SrichE-2G]MBP4041104.1 hypothetical protein [Aeromonas sp. SrichE-2G]